MANFFVCVLLASPLWVPVLPFISANRTYCRIISGVCFLLFTVEPVWTSVVDRGGDAGLGMFLSLGTAVLAAVVAAVLLAATRKRHHRMFFGVMLGCAVAGILGVVAVRM